MVSTIGLVWPLLSLIWGARLAKLIGFNGLQAAPSRGIPCRSVTRAMKYLGRVQRILKIVLIEGSWAGGSGPWSSDARIVFANPRAIGVRQWALRSIPDVVSVSHEAMVAKNNVVEAPPGVATSRSPDRAMTPEEFARWLEENDCYVAFDTLHGRRGSSMVGPENAGSTWSDWRRNLELFGHRVLVVHFQPWRDNAVELFKWLHGEPTELGEIIREVLVRCPDVEYWVVELPPPDGVFRKIIWVLTVPFMHVRVLAKLRWELESV